MLKVFRSYQWLLFVYVANIYASFGYSPKVILKVLLHHYTRNDQLYCLYSFFSLRLSLCGELNNQRNFILFIKGGFQKMFYFYSSGLFMIKNSRFWASKTIRANAECRSTDLDFDLLTVKEGDFVRLCLSEYFITSHSGIVDIHDIFTFWMLLVLYVCLLAYTFRLPLYRFKGAVAWDGFLTIPLVPGSRRVRISHLFFIFVDLWLQLAFRRVRQNFSTNYEDSLGLIF